MHSEHWAASQAVQVDRESRGIPESSGGLTLTSPIDRRTRLRQVMTLAARFNTAAALHQPAFLTRSAL